MIWNVHIEILHSSTLSWLCLFEQDSFRNKFAVIISFFSHFFCFSKLWFDKKTLYSLITVRINHPNNQHWESIMMFICIFCSWKMVNTSSSPNTSLSSVYWTHSLPRNRVLKIISRPWTKKQQQCNIYVHILNLSSFVLKQLSSSFLLKCLLSRKQGPSEGASHTPKGTPAPPVRTRNALLRPGLPHKEQVRPGRVSLPWGFSPTPPRLGNTVMPPWEGRPRVLVVLCPGKSFVLVRPSFWLVLWRLGSLDCPRKVISPSRESPQKS